MTTLRLPVLLTAILLALQTTVTAQSAQLAFEEASAALANAEYDRAMAGLRAVEASGFQSGPLFLNTAIGYTALDSLGMAKFYYTRAAGFPDTRDAAEKGLQFVENRLRYRTAKLPELPWQRFFRLLDQHAGPRLLLIGCLVLTNLAGFLIAFAWFRPGLRRALRWALPLLVFFALFCGLSAWKIVYDDARYDRAIQILSETRILDRPQADALLISNSFEGYEFTVDYRESAKAPGWYYVRMSNGLFGWIEQPALRLF